MTRQGEHRAGRDSGPELGDPRERAAKKPAKAPVDRRKLSPARLAAKARTREALLDAALKLYCQQGFDQPGLDTICELAGRTRGAYHVHFKSRDALLEAVASRGLTELERRTLGASMVGLSAAEQRAQLMRGLVDSRPSAKELPLPLLLHAAARSEAVREELVGLLSRIAKNLAEATAREHPAAAREQKRVEPEQLATLILALATGLDLMSYMGAKVEREQLVGVVTALLSTRPPH